MSTGLGIVRVLLLVVGALALLGGFALVVSGGEAAIGAIYLVPIGAVLLLAVAFERFRYRSEGADQIGTPVGPGGGESLEGPMDPRFRRTNECFEDPTTRLRMRVWLDPATGERRYRAEG